MLNKSVKAVISSIEKATRIFINDEMLMISTYGSVTTAKIPHTNKVEVALAAGCKAGIAVDKPIEPINLSELTYVKTQTITINELEHLMAAMAINDVRYYLNGIALFDNNCSISTDGHRMHTVNYNLNIATDVLCAIVPAESIKIIHKLLKAEKADKLAIDVYTNGKGVSGFYCKVVIGKANIHIKCIDGHFPNCGRVYPAFGSRQDTSMGRVNGTLLKLSAKQTATVKQVIKFSKCPFIGCQTVNNITTLYNPTKSEKHKLTEEKLDSLNAMLSDCPLLSVSGVDKNKTPIFNVTYILEAKACAGGNVYLNGEIDKMLIESGNLAAVIMPMRG
jgi:DNA polymerase III sliding clamp (beta) subunit (PCNA family)